MRICCASCGFPSLAQRLVARRRAFRAVASVVLETDAPPEAVICVIPKRADAAKEREVVIDRHRFGSVRVLHRYAQVRLEEFDAEMKQACSAGAEEELVRISHAAGAGCPAT